MSWHYIIDRCSKCGHHLIFDNSRGATQELCPGPYHNEPDHKDNPDKKHIK